MGVTSEITPDTRARAFETAEQTRLVQRLTTIPGGVLLALPPSLATAAVEELLDDLSVEQGRVLADPKALIPGLGALGPDRWAIELPSFRGLQLGRTFLNSRGLAVPDGMTSQKLWWVFPRWCVQIRRGYEYLVRRALHEVTPEALTEDGVPEPWVAAKPPKTTLGAGRDLSDDVEVVAAGEPLPPVPETPEVLLNPDDNDTIRAALRRTCRRAGIGDVPLDVERVAAYRDGFVPGRVWLSPEGPLQVRLVVGPNADAAEVWATLLHEVAHGIAGIKEGHGRIFQQALVDLAGAMFGDDFFRVPRSKLGESHGLLDAWIAVGVRASLGSAAPPVEASGSETQLAKVVGRIQKLRRLAQAQLGQPEGRAACAKANDLLTRWDLGAYSVRLAGGIDDQMYDRWVNIGKRSVWRRRLAFIVAEHCGVFSLSRASKGWMHFFGRYADVVTAQWFYEIWEAHILRAADAHIKAYKASGGHRHTRTERINFCDSAVYGLEEKLGVLERQHDHTATPDERITTRRRRSEAFAAEQFDLRGQSWGSGTGKQITVNAAGVNAGQNAPMGRGVGGPAGVRGLLKD